MQEHLALLSARSKQARRVRRILEKAPTAEAVADAGPLWAEEREATQHLNELAGWERRVDGVREVIKAVEARTGLLSAAEEAAPPAVYDGVLNHGACAAVDAFAQQWGGLGHTLYRRDTTGPRTPLEAALESILVELGDDAPVVEYWWRDEWGAMLTCTPLGGRR